MYNTLDRFISVWNRRGPGVPNFQVGPNGPPKLCHSPFGGPYFWSGPPTFKSWGPCWPPKILHEFQTLDLLPNMIKVAYVGNRHKCIACYTTCTVCYATCTASSYIVTWYEITSGEDEVYKEVVYKEVYKEQLPPIKTINAAHLLDSIFCIYMYM